MVTTKDLKVNEDQGLIRYNGVVVARFAEMQGRLPFSCEVFEDDFFCASIDDMVEQVCKYLNLDFQN